MSFFFCFRPTCFEVLTTLTEPWKTWHVYSWEINCSLVLKLCNGDTDLKYIFPSASLILLFVFLYLLSQSSSSYWCIMEVAAFMEPPISAVFLRWRTTYLLFNMYSIICRYQAVHQVVLTLFNISHDTFPLSYSEDIQHTCRGEHVVYTKSLQISPPPVESIALHLS